MDPNNIISVNTNSNECHVTESFTQNLCDHIPRVLQLQFSFESKMLKQVDDFRSSFPLRCSFPVESHFLCFSCFFQSYPFSQANIHLLPFVCCHPYQMPKFVSTMVSITELIYCRKKKFTTKERQREKTECTLRIPSH